MPRRFTCAQGHEWETSAEEPASVCPTCGAAAALPAETALFGETLPPPRAPTAELPGETLPPPRPPVPASVDTSSETLPPPPPVMMPAEDYESGDVTLPPPPSAPFRAAGAPEETLPPPTAPAPGHATHRIAPARTPRARGAAGDTQRRGPTDATQGPGVPENAESTMPASTGLVVGPTIPGYRLLGELGRGGMGVVYRALDIKLNRTVALKMILSGDYAEEADLARFRLEAEAVAKLQHPNIVQVFEIDECDGKPFFSLEFVDGGPLDKKLGGDPLPARRAAELAHDLARAMAYAHQRDILHRDLKPANVLLTKDGAPKITDFGLAKKLDDKENSKTQGGTIMGTPSYMAPEQARGKINELGPAADTYSLGAILYEFLTGRPPFKGATVIDTLEQVCNQEPVPPSRLQPKVARDLETICLKCLQKEAPKRYASAGALADDLKRFLDGEPIQARPTPAWERAWKWARRRPAAAALIVVSGLAVFSLGIGGVLYAEKEKQRAAEANHLRQVAENERNVAEEQRALAEKQRNRAEENFASARDAVKELTLIGHQRLAHEPHMELVRRDILEQALRFHQRFLKANGANPALRWETGLAQLRAGEIEEYLGRTEPAEKAYLAARDAFVALAADKPDHPEYRRDLAATWNDLGILYQETNRPEDANKAFQKALDLKQALVKDFPTERDYRRDLGNSFNSRGNLRMTQKRFPEAEADFQQALKLFGKLAADQPLKADAAPQPRGGPQGEDQVRADYLQELARTQNLLGAVFTAIGAPGAERAEKAYSQAVTMWTTLTTRYPDVPEYRKELAATHLNRGTLRHLNSRANEALADYRDAEKRLRELAGQFRSVPDYRQLLANSYDNLGLLFKQANQPADAEKIWRLSLPLLTALSEELPKEPSYRQRLGRSHNELAIALAMQSKYADSQTSFRDALRVQEQLVTELPADGTVWADLINSHVNLTSLLSAIGPAKEAEASAHKLIDAQQRRLKAFPKEHAYRYDLARAEHMLAEVLLQSKSPAEARKALEGAVQHAKEALDAEPKTLPYRQAVCTYSIALIELHLGQGDHAEVGRVVRELVLAVAPQANAAGILSADQAAALLARSIPLIDKDGKLSEGRRKELKQARGNEAIKLLRLAVEQGYKDAKTLKMSMDFAALRSRDDFQQLLQQMEK